MFQLAKQFDEVVDNPMKRLGYCCGQIFVFEPRVLPCYGKEGCGVKVDARFYTYTDTKTNMTHNYCMKCYKTLGDYIDVGSNM